jgi:hypothetical protein
VSLISAAPAVAAIYSQWSVGQEREVDEGVYFKLVEVKNGWRLWRIETEKEIDCRAVKSVAGKRHPFPIGVMRAFYFGEDVTPFITLLSLDGNIRYSWKGRDPQNTQVQIRQPGEKFWVTDDGHRTLSDGARLEVNVSSWEYPAISVGYHEAKGIIDLTGLDEMTAEISRCSRRKP